MTVRASRTDSDTAPAGAPVPITQRHGARAAAERVVEGDTVTVSLGGLRFELPPRDQLAYLAGLGLLTAFDLIEWPVALAIAVGHELARTHRGKTLREFGDALEQA
ncbi:hypothetical protein ABZ723_01500 [Streptomyces sp. NPDC006700]|uniref:hypothetical protein n=1 Tax=unclassified Streptomyces TaxID=2593676 RepID=UPI0033CEF65B